jgi:hypothetical protein
LRVKETQEDGNRETPCFHREPREVGLHKASPWQQNPKALPISKGLTARKAQESATRNTTRNTTRKHHRKGLDVGYKKSKLRKRIRKKGHTFEESICASQKAQKMCTKCGKKN